MTNAGDVNKRSAPDPGRAVIASLVGIYGEGAARAMSGPSSTTGLGVKTEQFAHISDRPFLSVRLVQFPDYMPRGGDHVLRKATAQLYRIAEPLNDGFGLVRLDLNHIAGV